MNLKTRIQDDMKAAMRAKDAERLGTIRMLLAAMKQREVDERVELDDPAIVSIIDKMIKQRRDAITQFEAGNRSDLAAKEGAEIAVLEPYLPERLSEDALDGEIRAAIKDTGAKGPQELGKVMGILKSRLAGRADMAQASARAKALLGQA
ncbi:GatB/YqeY domain-containing protein [Thiomonas sp. FB-Cd]|uniref:GatB/YqeY domain-containing protein n=1 Tax=Thiomonas sp. FB-Cd TaxID=1158292 RepID=UPI0004DEF92E|nr:GatB/YqeY domain-containing protein [Thiomonas sp. FB-Cd]